ncbi:MAG: DNA repair exonuclease [Gemmatimonadetes bacterium]|nr:DNA repair exonuclease [Gemmatimonadota bacterium]
MRLLHIADVHLDTPFAGRSEPLRRRLQDASREAFRRAVDLALAEGVHAVVVAGDLFDGERLSFRTERFLLEQMARLGEAGVTVVYGTGNHDPGRDAYRTRPLPWPDHVIVADDASPRRVVVLDGEERAVGRIVAVGHASRRETGDLSAAFPAPGPDLPEIAVLHTQVRGSRDEEAHDPYAPCELARLQASGHDYWALGHVHLRQCLWTDPPIHYPGNLQGRTHKESGAKGALLVDLTDRRAPSVAFHSLAPVRFETVRVDGLEEAGTLDRLVRRAAAAWEAAREADPGDAATEWVVRFVLEGGTPLWASLGDEEEREALASDMAEALGLLDVEVRAGATHPVVQVEAHLRREDVLGAALRLVAAIRDGEATLPGLAPEELAGLDRPDAGDPGAYVRRLLEGAEAEVAARLLDPSARGAG